APASPTQSAARRPAKWASQTQLPIGSSIVGRGSEGWQEIRHVRRRIDLAADRLARDDVVVVPRILQLRHPGDPAVPPRDECAFDTGRRWPWIRRAGAAKLAAGIQQLQLAVDPGG